MEYFRILIFKSDSLRKSCKLRKPCGNNNEYLYFSEGNNLNPDEMKICYVSDLSKQVVISYSDQIINISMLTRR